MLEARALLSKETTSTDESKSEEDVIEIESEEESKVTSEQETEIEPEEQFEIVSDDVSSKEEAGFRDDLSGFR